MTSAPGSSVVSASYEQRCGRIDSPRTPDARSALELPVGSGMLLGPHREAVGEFSRGVGRLTLKDVREYTDLIELSLSVKVFGICGFLAPKLAYISPLSFDSKALTRGKWPKAILPRSEAEGRSVEGLYQFIFCICSAHSLYILPN